MREVGYCEGTLNCKGRSRDSTSATSRLSATPQKLWCFSDLRPAPPLRPQQLMRARHLKKDERWHDEDNVILRVVEAYCASAVSRYASGQNTTVRSASEDLSPFGGHLQGASSRAPNAWCCGLAINAIKKNVQMN
ncbi:hypothetical protein FHG87_020472 [Trinorchestia longiramus]|nr:hypothetical protein FHG87_020472 [Trinorchestia longiramus]